MEIPKVLEKDCFSKTNMSPLTILFMLLIYWTDAFCIV